MVNQSGISTSGSCSLFPILKEWKNHLLLYQTLRPDLVLKRSVFSCMLIATLFIYSCEFEPTATIVTPVNPPSAQNVSIDLNGYPNQEIYLKNTTPFTYQVNADGKQLVNTEVYLDDKKIYEMYSSSGAFELNPQSLSNGSHKLRIMYIAKSGNGSLADTFDAERLYVWIERTVIITPVPDVTQAVKISSISNVDGTIRISWTPASTDGFQNYQLSRKDYNKQGDLIATVSFPAQSPAGLTSYDDHSYLPGKSEYILTINTQAVSYSTDPMVYQHPYDPKLSYTIQADGTVTLSFNSLLSLKANFQGYKLFIRNTSSYDHSYTFTPTIVSDTVVTVKPDNWFFGSIRGMEFTVSRPPSSTVQAIVYKYSLRYGEAFPAFSPIEIVAPVYHAQTGKYYLLRSGRLSSADAAGHLIDSTATQYNNIKLAADFAIGETYEGVYKKINLQTFSETVITLPMPYLTGLASDGTIACGDGTNIAIYSPLGVELNRVSVYGFLGFSEDASYFYTVGVMNKFNGSKYLQSLTFWDNDFYLRKSTTFIPETNPVKAVWGFTKKLTLLNLSTGAYTEASTQYRGPCNYDPYSDKLGCYSGDKYVVLNASDLSLYKSITVAPGADAYYLLNSRILCPAGMQLKLSDIP